MLASVLCLCCSPPSACDSKITALAPHLSPTAVQVGQKVRVVGAELRSDRAAEPLDAARTALLKVAYNSISPAPWDAKLGPVPAGETLRCAIGKKRAATGAWGCTGLVACHCQVV